MPSAIFVFAHEDAIDSPAADLEGQLSRKRRCEAVGDGVRLDPDAVTGLEAGPEGLRLLGLDGDDPRAALEGGDDAGDEAAAAHADDDRLDVGDVFEHLERERPVAGDHVRVVVRVDEDAAGLLDDVHRALVRDHVVGRLEVDGGAVAARGAHLRAGSRACS